MADITIYQKPTCTTCKEVYQILKEANADFDAIDYFTDPIPKTKLKELIQKLGLPIEELIRKKDQLFQDLRLGEKTTYRGSVAGSFGDLSRSAPTPYRGKRRQGDRRTTCEEHKRVSNPGSIRRNARDRFSDQHAERSGRTKHCALSVAWGTLFS